jgi:hypothetical protein
MEEKRFREEQGALRKENRTSQLPVLFPLNTITRANERSIFLPRPQPRKKHSPPPQARIELGSIGTSELLIEFIGERQPKLLLSQLFPGPKPGTQKKPFP